MNFISKTKRNSQIFVKSKRGLYLNWIFMVFTIVRLFGQNTSENTIKHQIEFRHDNDFFVLTDRYYSTGLFLTFRHALDKGVFGSRGEQISIQIGQEAYTPDNIESDNIADFDRPYVGFLGLNTGWSYFKNNTGIHLNLLFGIAGKASGAGSFQRWYHNAIVISDPQAWVAEMENTFHANFYASYLYEWRLAPNPFSVHLAVNPQIAVGSRDTYLHPEVIAYFGRRNHLSSTIAQHRIGATEREIFFSLRAGYRFVSHNGLLEGNAFGDNSIFLIPSKRTVLFLGFDFQHRYGKNDYRVGYRHNSSEAETTETHQYITLSYARSF